MSAGREETISRLRSVLANSGSLYADERRGLEVAVELLERTSPGEDDPAWAEALRQIHVEAARRRREGPQA